MERNVQLVLAMDIDMFTLKDIHVVDIHVADTKAEMVRNCLAKDISIDNNGRE